jgi:hypothetical protein
LFLRTISPSILSPADARSYFDDLKFPESCPILWTKIEPLIIEWEKEILRLEKEVKNITYKDLDSQSIEFEILKSKQEFQAPIDKTLIQDDPMWIDEKDLKQTQFGEDANTVSQETYLEETKITQELEVIQNEEIALDSSILGKRLETDLDTINVESKLTKIE